MKKKYNEWHKGLTPFKKLAVSIMLDWFYWFIAWLMAEQFLFEEEHSWKYHVFHATWMAFFMTIPFNWKQLKQVFKPQKEREASLEDSKGSSE